jgi:molecular chaperone HscB
MSAVAARVLTSRGGTGETCLPCSEPVLKNHFELFGLTPAYALDLEHLDRAYRDIQAQVHPDRFANAGDAERRASMQMTTQVNEAYRTLKSSVQRAKYLLEMSGVDLGFETNTAMPREFLMEQMELREKLEEAKQGSDLESISRALAAEKRDIENRIRDVIDGKRDFVAATDLVRKLMFLEKFGEEIDAAYETLDS